MLFSFSKSCMDMGILDQIYSLNLMTIVQGAISLKSPNLCVENQFRLNSFPLRCISQWNNLTEDIVCCDTVVSFKTKLDKALRSDRFNLTNIY